MTNGGLRFIQAHRHFESATRLVFKAVRQCPIASRLAIHDQVVGVSPRNGVAM
jgi:hypothetical protein